MPTPIIGITIDQEPPGGYSKFPWFALRENYSRAVSRAGGVPVLLPPDPDRAEDYLALIDGLLISGGAFDLDPALYGVTDTHPSVTTKDQRTAFEWLLARDALAGEMPVLGICGGQQLLHVVLGGTLYQHLPDELPGPINHEQPNPRNEPSHTVQLTPGTQLQRIYGVSSVAVNSAHHQAAKDVSERIRVNAVAEDGVIEGIEAPDHRFCIGVQWHPEFELSDGDRRLFAAFVDASRG